MKGLWNSVSIATEAVAKLPETGIAVQRHPMVQDNPIYGLIFSMTLAVGVILCLKS